MSTKGKPWKTRGSNRIVKLDEAAFGGEVQPVEQSATKIAAPSGTAEGPEVLAALNACYKSKAFMDLRSREADEMYAAELGIKLRKNKKGQMLAVQKEDVPKGADFSLTVTVSDASGNPVQRRLGGSIRYNRNLGLAIAAGRYISDTRKQEKDVQEQAKLLGMELAHMRATKKQKTEVFGNFYAPHTVRVALGEAIAYLSTAEPKLPSRRQQQRESMKQDGLQRVDDLIATVRASR